MEIRPLRESDDRSAFRSGDADLDRFFHKFAGQNQFRHHIGTTYVAIEGRQIGAFATVAPGHIEVEELPPELRKRLPRYPLPILRLARLAVNESFRGQGLGKELLGFVFGLALRMASEFGCLGIVVDAKPGAVSFYGQFGFQPLEVVQGRLPVRPAATAMFLRLTEIQAAYKPSQ